MQFAREINRILLGILAMLLVVAIAASYWAIVGAETILKRQDNPRRVEVEANIQRGSIRDRNDNLLVNTIRETNGSTRRQYLYPETYSALGYFSLRYGTSGTEAAHNMILRGDDLPRDINTYLSTDLLHQPQKGSDIRLTFDLAIQQALAQAMTDYQGAAIVISVPSGQVLAMVSLPTFDPNTLDTNWEQFVEAPGNPFFNRALQGNYQPGGTLQTPLVAAALLTGASLDTPLDNATAPITAGDVEVRCAAFLPPRELTLREAYTFGCPRPFAQLAEKLGIEGVQAILDTFRLSEPPTLPGFVAEPAQQASQTPSDIQLTADNLENSALGQGTFTVTPLEMAMIAAAVVNDGNAPQPHTLLAIRPPESDTWLPAEELHPTVPLMTANTARQLQDMMRLAVAAGTAQNAGRPNIDIGGHATLAYSGDGTQAWFIGFTTVSGKQGIAIAVVIENSSDPGLAAHIGGTALAAARDALTE